MKKLMLKIITLVIIKEILVLIKILMQMMIIQIQIKKDANNFDTIINKFKILLLNFSNLNLLYKKWMKIMKLLEKLYKDIKLRNK